MSGNRWGHRIPDGRGNEAMASHIATHKVAGIGSGNFIDEYKKSLDELSENHEQNFSMCKWKHRTLAEWARI
jgi:hypothetical protein